MTVDGIFDITGTTTGAEIIRLLGTDPTAQILLGSKLLALTGDGASAYAGTIAGDAASGLAIQDGTLVLTGPSPGFLGTATIESDAALRLAGAGSVTGATIDLAGLFDISGITAGGTSVADLSGTGEIDLGHKTLAVTDATGGTFSGPLTGDGAFGVAGGLLNLDFTGNPTVNANIFAATGGKVGLTGGTIDTTASDQPALSVINGGSIDVTNTKLVTGAAHPAASVLFDDGFDVANNPAHIALGTGTVLQNEGRLLEVTRDNTGGTGNAFAGDVHFIIDNASVVVGDILDPDAQRRPDGTHLAGGQHTVSIWAVASDWTGRAVAGDFLVKAGAGAHFAAGSLLDNLTAESGALVNILTGNPQRPRQADLEQQRHRGPRRRPARSTSAASTPTTPAIRCGSGSGKPTRCPAWATTTPRSMSRETSAARKVSLERSTPISRPRWAIWTPSSDQDRRRRNGKHRPCQAVRPERPRVVTRPQGPPSRSGRLGRG